MPAIERKAKKVNREELVERLKQDFTETEKLILRRRSVRLYKHDQVPEFMIKRILEGINFSEETLALDVIEKVGPGGNFVSEKHTKKHFREVEWFPKLINRQNLSDWELSGSKTMTQRVNERVKEILSTHQVPPLSDGVEKTIEKIFKKYGEKT